MNDPVSSIVPVSELLKYIGPHVYIWERDGAPLYVGSSCHVLSRLDSHEVVGKKEPFQIQDRIELIPCSSKEEMCSVEIRLIQRHEPIHNRAYNPQYKLNKAKDRAPRTLKTHAELSAIAVKKWAKKRVQRSARRLASQHERTTIQNS